MVSAASTRSCDGVKAHAYPVSGDHPVRSCEPASFRTQRDKDGRRSPRLIEAYSLSLTRAGEVLLLADRADNGQSRSNLVIASGPGSQGYAAIRRIFVCSSIKSA